MEFGMYIRDYEKDIIKDLAELVAIPSVADHSGGVFPYGSTSAHALHILLIRAQEMGLEVKNIGDYAGHAEYGSGANMSAVLTHVDVVPAGNGWDTDPFKLTQKGALYYGRGVVDNKGPAVVALYCLKALSDHRIRGKRRLRAIFGCGEEIGMQDMKVYFENEPLPDRAFTPDSEYGIGNREKGILQFELLEIGHDSSVVKFFEAGTVINAVPDSAVVKLTCNREEVERLQALCENSADCTFCEKADCVTVTVTGKAAHAMEPELGKNAATQLISLLFEVFSAEQLGSVLSFVQNRIHSEQTGEALGIAVTDQESGALTVNVGKVFVNLSEAYIHIDIRYPVTSNGDHIVEQISNIAGYYNLKLKVKNLNPPLYVHEDSPLITMLKKAYKSVTADNATLYSTGGGTYARSVQGHGVAFGPVFTDEPNRNLHNANEHFDIHLFMKHAEICLEAMYLMIMEE